MRAEQNARELTAAKQHASSRNRELDRWTMWLADVLKELNSTKPIGGLPETAHSQLDEFRILKADVEQKRSALEADLER